MNKTIKKFAGTGFTAIAYLLVTLLLTAACTARQQKGNSTKDNPNTPLTLKVMSFNMRYNNSADANNAWPHRTDSVAKLIHKELPDVIGAQELLKEMLTDVLRLAPQYEYVGVGREDGKEKGEYSAILYNKKRFKLLDKGWLWLSETPNTPSKGWDAACERILTWAILQDSTTGRKMACFNTHFDHVGQLARKKSAQMLLDAVEQYANGYPVVVTGDFNASPNDTAIQLILNKQQPLHLTEAREVALQTEGPQWSYHEWGKLPLEKRPLIDPVFLKGEIEVKTYRLWAEPDTPERVYLSDHAPVVVEVAM